MTSQAHTNPPNQSNQLQRYGRPLTAYVEDEEENKENQEPSETEQDRLEGPSWEEGYVQFQEASENEGPNSLDETLQQEAFGMFSTSEAETCRRCKKSFRSRNKLHAHLREACLRRDKQVETSKSQDDTAADSSKRSKTNESMIKQTIKLIMTCLEDPA